MFVIILCALLYSQRVILLQKKDTMLFFNTMKDLQLDLNPACKFRLGFRHIFVCMLWVLTMSLDIGCRLWDGLGQQDVFVLLSRTTFDVPWHAVVMFVPEPLGAPFSRLAAQHSAKCYGGETSQRRAEASLYVKRKEYIYG